MSFQLTRNQQAIGLLSTLLISAIPMLPSSAVAQQACVMTKAGKKVCGTLILMGTPNTPVVIPSRSTKTTSSKSLGSTVVIDYPNDVKVSAQLEKCYEYVSDVLCILNVTKIQGENDNKGGVVASLKVPELGEIKSEAIDDKDRSYTATRVRARIDSSEQGILITLSKNRTIPVTYVFKIPDDVKTLKKLTFPIVYGKSDAKVATFSNINVGR
jgi:uncharacterized membrane protein